MSDIVKITLENAGASALGAGVATFGQVFLPGEVPSGSGLIATTSGGTQPVQLDVKTRYADGSVKMAVVSIERPDLAAGGKVEVTLGTGASASQPALDLGEALKGHSFSVDVNVHGGSNTQIDVLGALQKALADGTASVWQDGSLATQARVEVALEGSQRMIFDVTAYKGGGFSVDAQFNNDRAMEATGGRVNYHVSATMDGREVLSETVNQDQYQNWHESFSSNATDGGQGTGSPDSGWLNIRQDIAHLQAAGAVAGYDLGLTIDPATLSAYGDATQSAGWGDPLATNGVTQYMPMTGGRADIGFTTEANASWLISQDPRAAAFALGQAETASSVPWNFWDKANGSWLSTDDYPDLWTDGRGGTGTPGDASSGGLTQQVDSQNGWTIDVAHQPDLSFVPYVLTGERWMLDNLQAQASASVVGQWTYSRGGADDNLIYGSQVRGAAWSLRQVDEAAWAAPDGSAEKAYFQEVSDANYAYLVSKIPEWTAMQGEAHGWLPGTYGTEGALPPWQQDYFASTVIAAASRGNEDALTFLNWQANFLVGRFTHAAEGFDMHDGAAYLLAISEEKPDGAIYTTWRQIAAETDARDFSNDDGWAHSQGDYAQLALATLAGIYRLTGSEEAKAAYEALIADDAPFSSPADFAKSPTYALAAPGGAAGKPAVPTQPSPPAQHPDPTPGQDNPPVQDTPPAQDHPPAQTPEAGLKALAIVLGADSWEGDPLAVVLVDGHEVFRGAISASHGSGGQRIELGHVSADAAHAVTVQFLNDAWGGSYDADRNLHVEDLLVDGVSVAEPETMSTSGERTFNFEAGPAQSHPPVQDTPPVQETPPSQSPAPEAGLKALAVVLGADSWEGDPLAVILVDGREVFRGDISASHASGGQRIELGHVSADAEHAVTVQFLNDAWGGSYDADRNLHVEDVLVDGVSIAEPETMSTSGERTFNFGSDQAGQAGPDVLRISVSGDAWNGDAQFALFVDGVQMGGDHYATASHAAAETQVLELQGNFGGGGHELAVRFLNDAWGGSADADRNLYVDKVEFNGADQHHQAALNTWGDAIFAF